MSKAITKDKNNKVLIEMPLERISSININPRIALDEGNVKKLIEAEDYSPVYLGIVGKDIIVIDGYHRVEAAKRKEKISVTSYIMEFANLEEAEMEAFKANLNHGLRLDDAEIARGIVKYFHKSLKSDNKKTLKEVVTEYGLPYRNGSVLYHWSLFNHIVLGNDTNNLSRRSFFESFKVMLGDEDESNISEEFKVKFKEFYSKYSELDRASLRIAISMYMEGKDYFEENNKDEKEVKTLTVNAETGEIIEPKTNFNLEKEENLENDEDEVVEKAKPVCEKELRKKTEELKENNSSNIVTCSGLLEKGSTEIMEFMFMTRNKHCCLTNDDIENLKNLVDSINVFLEENKKEENKTFFGDV